MSARCKYKSRSPIANSLRTCHLQPFHRTSHRAVWLWLLDSRGKESFHVQTPGSRRLAGPHHWVRSLVPGRTEAGLPTHVGRIHGKPTPQPRRQGGCCVRPAGAVLIRKPGNQSLSAASSDKTGCHKPGADALASGTLVSGGVAAGSQTPAAGQNPGHPVKSEFQINEE